MTKSAIEFEWTLLPGVSVGPYRLGAPISDYPELAGAGLDLPDSVGEVAYATMGGEDDFMVFADDAGNVSHVDCYSSIYFGGNNLIGKTQRQLCDILESVPDQVEEQEMGDEIQTILHFDRLGIMAWLRGGLAVTIQCSLVFDD